MNNRPLLFTFAAIVVGFLIAYINMFVNEVASFLLLGIVVAGVCALTVIKFNNKYLAFISANRVFIFVLGVLCVLSSVVTNITFDSYLKVQNFVGVNTVSGTIVQNSTSYLVIDDAKVDGKEVQSNIRVYTEDSFELELFNEGNVVQFDSIVYPYSDENITSSLVLKDIAYYANVVTSADVAVGEKANLTNAEQVKADVYNLLRGSLSLEAANVLFAMMFGDTADIDTQTYAAFSDGGLAHVLAVSGLHVGLIVLLLWIMLSFIPQRFRIILILPLLFYYCYLCSFATSVVRASIMAAVLLVSRTFGRKYDALSSLSFAGILLFILDATVLMDFGFWLSFCSVLGIVLFSSKFASFFEVRCKINRKIASALAITTSAQLLTLPIVLYMFKNISLIGFVTNVFLLPFVVFAFYLAIAFVLITALLPSAAFLFAALDIFMKAILFVLTFVASLPFANLKVLPLTIFGIICYYLLIITSSKIVFSKNKVLVCLLLVCLTLGNFIYTNTSSVPAYSLVNIKTNFGSTTLINAGEENTLVVLDNIDYYNVTDYLNSSGVREVETIVYARCKEENSENFEEFVEYFDVQSIYLPQYQSSYDLDFANINFIYENIKIGEMEISAVQEGVNFYGIEASYNKTNVAFLASNNTNLSAFNVYATHTGERYNAIVVKYGGGSDVANTENHTEVVVCSRSYSEVEGKEYNVYLQGSWTFKF